MGLWTISGFLQRVKPNKASGSRREGGKNNNRYNHDLEIAEESHTSRNIHNKDGDTNEHIALHHPDRSSTFDSSTPSEMKIKPFKGKKQLRQRIAEVEKANSLTTPPHKEAQRTYSTTSLGGCSTYSGRAASLTPSTRSSVPSQVSIEGPSEAEIAIEAIINHYPKLRKGLRRSQLPRRQRRILNKELDAQLTLLRTLSVRIKEVLRDQPEDHFSNFDFNDLGQKLNMLESKIDLQRSTLFNSKRCHSEGFIDGSRAFEASSAEFTSISNQISELLDIVNGASGNLGTHTHMSQISVS